MYLHACVYNLKLTSKKTIVIASPFSFAVNSIVPSAELSVDPRLAPPTDHQCKLLRQVLLTGLGDHVARKMAPPTVENSAGDAKKLRLAYKVRLGSFTRRSFDVKVL